MGETIPPLAAESRVQGTTTRGGISVDATFDVLVVLAFLEKLAGVGRDVFVAGSSSLATGPPPSRPDRALRVGVPSSSWSQTDGQTRE